MQKDKEIELLKRNNSSLGVAVFFSIICLGLFFLAFYKDQLALQIIFIFFSLLIALALIKLKTLFFYDNRIVLKKYWQKKVVWTCYYNEIKKVEIDFFSDTSSESKQLCFTLNNGTKLNSTIVHVLLEKIVKIFNEKEIPVYKKLNGNYALVGKTIHKDIKKDNL